MATLAQQLIETDRILIAAIEERIGNNLQWLYDQFDLELRQKDPDVTRRLTEINEAWEMLAKMKHH